MRLREFWPVELLTNAIRTKIESWCFGPFKTHKQSKKMKFRSNCVRRKFPKKLRASGERRNRFSDRMRV